VIELICQNCGKTFYRYPSQAVRARFCSRTCQGKINIRATFSRESIERRAKTRRGFNQPKEVKDKISNTLTGRSLLTAKQIKERTRACLQCGNPLYEPPHRVRRGEGKFCSARCRELYHWANPEYRNKRALAIKRGQSIRPTSPEKQLIGLLATHFPQFKYNGDGRLGVTLGGLTPDFVNINGKKDLIEVFGDYYHSPEFLGNKWKGSELGRIMVYNSLGYRCLVIWEHELKGLAEKQIVNKIKEFSRR